MGKANWGGKRTPQPVANCPSIEIRNLKNNNPYIAGGSFLTLILSCFSSKMLQQKDDSIIKRSVSENAY